MNAGTRRMIGLAALALFFAATIALTAWSAASWIGMGRRIEMAEARAELPPAADPARYLLIAPSRAEASGDLQERLNEAASAAGLTLSRVTIAPVDTSDTGRMAAEIETSGSMGELAAFLHAVESSLPALIVPEASLRPIREAEVLRLNARIEARLSPGAVE